MAFHDEDESVVIEFDGELLSALCLTALGIWIGYKVVGRLLAWAVHKDAEIAQPPLEESNAANASTGVLQRPSEVSVEFLRVERQHQSGLHTSAHRNSTKWGGLLLRAAVVVVLVAATPSLLTNESNLYRRLEVSRRTSISEITKSYRRLSRKLHPDKANAVQIH